MFLVYIMSTHCSLLQLEPSVPGGLAAVPGGLGRPLPRPVVCSLPQPPQAIPEEASTEVPYHGGEGEGQGEGRSRGRG